MNDSYSMKHFFRNLYRTQGQQFAFRASDREEYEQWRKEFRGALRERLGLAALEQIGAEVRNRPPRLLGETKEDGFLRRKYVMETLPEVFMPFYMLIPDGAEADTGTVRMTTDYPEDDGQENNGTDTDRAGNGANAAMTVRGVGGKARAILAIPAHGANKNTVCGIAETAEEAGKIAEAPDECYGAVFARKGYVVFCPDPPGYGERVEPRPAEDVCFLGSQARTSLDCSCKDLAQTAEALGISLTALEIWELQRLLDFACGCPEVREDEQGKLIGCAGFSGGGQYSMWLAAMDDRIRLAVVSGYVHGYLDSLLECHLCPCNYAPGLWTLGDISDICCLIAPRPLFIENGTEDAENGPEGIAGPKRQAEKIRRAYRLLGREESMIHSTPAGPHRWYGTCYEFVEDALT